MTSLIQTNRCYSCKLDKTETEFSPSIWRRKSGHYCNSCRRVYYRGKYPEYGVRLSKKYRELKDATIRLYGGKCVCCSEARWQFLGIDHVNGGGRKDRARFSSKGFLSHAQEKIASGEYQLLCHNCNMAKGFYGKCPHTDEDADG